MKKTGFILIFALLLLLFSADNKKLDPGSDYFLKEAEVSWEKFYASLGNDEEREMWKAAANKVREQYLSPGEALVCDWMEERDDTFPQSGSAILHCTRWDLDDQFLWINIWITVDENHKIISSNNYMKQLLEQQLSLHGVKVFGEETNAPYQASDYIESYTRDLLVSYENQKNLPECMEAFSDACLEIKEKELPVDRYREVSQNVRFVESDKNTNMRYFYDKYPRHTIDFSSVSKEILQELSGQVQAENLSIMKGLRPKLYQAFLEGDKDPWEDYIKPYRMPEFTYCTVSGFPESYYSWPYRDAHVDSVKKNDKFYNQYRRQLVENGGAASTFTSERYQKYKFASTDAAGTYFDDNMFESGMSLSNDMYTIRIPYGFLYAYEESVSMDMIVPDIRNAPCQDMEILDIRKADRGRFYLLYLRREDKDEISLGDLLKQERVKERLAPILKEEAHWGAAGSMQSDYHTFEYVKGETELRNISVYMPQMKNGDEFVYLLLFEEFKDSEEPRSLYKTGDEMVDTFVMLPYWHQCGRGDTLERISRRYAGSSRYVRELCEDPLNQIANPNLIREGEHIEIPLNILLRREVYGKVGK